MRGRAFGFHRAGDTVGAIIGPLTGAALLALLPTIRPICRSAISFSCRWYRALRARGLRSRRPGNSPAADAGEETHRVDPPTAARFQRFLLAVGLFGSGDFSPTLLTLAAATLLRPSYGAVRAAELAALLYVIRNIVYASASFPIGALADRMRKLPLLSGGYFCAALVAAATALLFTTGSASFAVLAAVFVVSGIFAAAQDTLEGAIPPDLTEPKCAARSTDLGAVNGVGDLIASAHGRNTLDRGVASGRIRSRSRR